MKEKLSRIVTGLGADYADIRFEENHKTRISFRGKKLVEIASYDTAGGHVRTYVGGGKAVASFSDTDKAKVIAKRTAASAGLVGANRDKPLRLASAPVINDSFPIHPESDPRTIPLTDKLDLLASYNEMILKEPSVVTTEADYDEFVSRRVFVNSEGSLIEYDIIIVNLHGEIVTRKDGVIQRVRFKYGGTQNFAPLVGREDDLRARMDIARQLVEAEPARAGVYPVVLDPDEAGVFIHEAFGHLSEADGLQNNPAFREKLQFGTVLGLPILNVTDDPSLPGRPGTYVIDDEGVLGRKTQLLSEGVLTGRLHSRETAAEFDEPLSGNMRAVDVNCTPLVRMSNIFIEPGGSTFDDMIASIDHGYYLVGAWGGQTSGDQFTFGAQYGYRIDNGKLGPMVRDINMSGELFSTLKATSMIGDDVWFDERGGCGKGWPTQLNPKSGKGAPHIKIDQVTIGGI